MRLISRASTSGSSSASTRLARRGATTRRGSTATWSGPPGSDRSRLDDWPVVLMEQKHHVDRELECVPLRVGQAEVVQAHRCAADTTRYLADCSERQTHSPGTRRESAASPARSDERAGAESLSSRSRNARHRGEQRSVAPARPSCEATLIPCRLPMTSLPVAIPRSCAVMPTHGGTAEPATSISTKYRRDRARLVDDLLRPLAEARPSGSERRSYRDDIRAEAGADA